VGFDAFQSLSCFSRFSPFVQMQDETDAKIFTASPLEEETTSTPLYNMDEDYPARPEIQQPPLNEATDVAQNRPPSRLMSTFGAMHS